jgi:hypothetical protein
MRPLNKREEMIRDMNAYFKHFSKTFGVPKYAEGVSNCIGMPGSSKLKIMLRVKNSYRWGADNFTEMFVEREKFNAWRDNCALFNFVEHGNK